MRLKYANNVEDKVKLEVKKNKLTYYIDTMGCQMNENDSNKYMGILESLGFKKVENEQEANLVLFNTCCIRENAENTLFGRLGKLKSKKQYEKNSYIVVVGCMTQQKHILEQIKKSYKFVDIVLGTNSMHEFPKKLYELLINDKKAFEFLDIDGDVIEGVPIIYNDDKKASVSIIYGCNNFCTYCIVPYVRGRERSRNLEDIVEDVKKLEKKGYKEITLLGQNVNSYGTDLKNNISFSTLLNEICKVKGIEIIRFMSPHPKDFTDELIDTIAKNPQISRQIHLPLQSGSTKILNSMNRKYTKEEYLKVVDKIKIGIPEASFTTDIIVGFPGETKEDFEETLAVVEYVKYDQVYMFIYSKRTGTIAEKMEDITPYNEKVERLQKLKSNYEEILNENNNKLIGKTYKILIEGKSKNNDEYYTGRMYNNKIIIFEAAEELVGQIVNIEITDNHLWYLKGIVKK